jgi:hypothetical protein
VTSANAYLGAGRWSQALARGRQIVLCGRITDTALALAPLAHEFGWADDDWDRLAAGTIAGHILECGAQCTGGNFSRWWEVPDLAGVGYPIVEAHEDGTFTVTKHEGTGGMVTVDTVAEQLLYEMGTRGLHHPGRGRRLHLGPAEPRGRDRVRCRASRGAANTPLKISASYLAGYKATGQLTVSGPAGGREGAAGRRRGVEAAGARRRDLRGRRARGRARRRLGACLPGVLPAPPTRRRWCCGSACATPTATRSSVSARRSRR